MTDDLVERAAHAANIKRTNMTEISKEWCINMAKQEEGDIGAGKLAIDPTSDNFHKLALSESFERVAKVAEERDRCIHDEWMYDTCEGCLDDFIRKALQETER